MAMHTTSRSPRDPGSSQVTSSLADAMGALAPHHTTTPHTTPWYRREPWLAVCLASFLPVFAALLSPQSWRMPLTGVTGVLMGASMLMLFVHLRKLRTVAAREPRVPSSAPSQ